eukprot:scaffold70539_cov28-Tisochrysis_lutea.AAC.1
MPPQLNTQAKSTLWASQGRQAARAPIGARYRAEGVCLLASVQGLLKLGLRERECSRRLGMCSSNQMDAGTLKAKKVSLPTQLGVEKSVSPITLYEYMYT